MSSLLQNSQENISINKTITKTTVLNTEGDVKNELRKDIKRQLDSMEVYERNMSYQNKETKDIYFVFYHPGKWTKFPFEHKTDYVWSCCTNSFRDSKVNLYLFN